MKIFNRNIKTLFTSKDKRSSIAFKNIILSFGNKIFAVLISLAIVPLTIDYLDVEQYGIWLTVTSIVSWISFFDIGLGHGFRNKFAEAIANNDDCLARKYISTTYISLFLIFGIVLLLFECVNPLIPWSDFLKVSREYDIILRRVVAIVLIGVCCQFVANVFPIMLSSQQKTASASIIATVGQAFALIAIFVLTKLPNHNMQYIAIALTWIPVIFTIVLSFYAYSRPYKKYRPSFAFIDKSLISNILSLGVKFFIVQVSMIVIFQVVNIILSRECGPEAVTEYNVAYKYFSITVMINNIILSPFWPAFTDAYVKKDFLWMRKVHHKLIITWSFLFIISLLMLLISPFIFKIWLHGSVYIPFKTRVCMFLYVNILSFLSVNMTLINGTSKVLLQSIIYLAFALISIPLCIIASRIKGVPGIIMVISLVYIVQAVFASIQIKKIIDDTAYGIWDK